MNKEAGGRVSVDGLKLINVAAGTNWRIVKKIISSPYLCATLGVARDALGLKHHAALLDRQVEQVLHLGLGQG